MDVGAPTVSVVSPSESGDVFSPPDSESERVTVEETCLASVVEIEEFSSSSSSLLLFLISGGMIWVMVMLLVLLRL